MQGKIIFSSTEEVQQSFKKLNEETISYMQERVQDHISLSKYMLFQDIHMIMQKNNILEFHEFLDEDSIVSGIFPLEKAALPLINQLEAIDKQKKIYFSLETKQAKQVEACMADNDITLQCEFIEPCFTRDLHIRILQL